MLPALFDYSDMPTYNTSTDDKSIHSSCCLEKSINITSTMMNYTIISLLLLLFYFKNCYPTMMTCQKNSDCPQPDLECIYPDDFTAPNSNKG